jgi:hypothetical protein
MSISPCADHVAFPEDLHGLGSLIGRNLPGCPDEHTASMHSETPIPIVHRIGKTIRAFTIAEYLSLIQHID